MISSNAQNLGFQLWNHIPDSAAPEIRYLLKTQTRINRPIIIQILLRLNAKSPAAADNYALIKTPKTLSPPANTARNTPATKTRAVKNKRTANAHGRRLQNYQSAFPNLKFRNYKLKLLLCHTSNSRLIIINLTKTPRSRIMNFANGAD